MLYSLARDSTAFAPASLVLVSSRQTTRGQSRQAEAAEVCANLTYVATLGCAVESLGTRTSEQFD